MTGSDSTTIGTSPLRIALAAGGTGGHIMPTLALADALQKADPAVQLLFFSGTKEQEIRWYGQAGVTTVQLPAAPLTRGFAGKWRGGVGLLRSMKLARNVLKTFHPDAVVGLGSYVAGSTLLAALTMRLPVIIHEQNSVAGKTNRWLARHAAVVATTYPNSFANVRVKKLVLTGNPLRESVLEPMDQAEARQHFNLDGSRPTLLVFGASQGARGVNRAVLGLLERISGIHDLQWQLLWITGAAHFESISAQLSELSCQTVVKAVPFVQEIGTAYAAADVVVCRASSSSLAEAAAWGRPMIAVPFPYAADDHQRHNAQYFADAGACVAIDERNLTPERLLEEVQKLFSSPDLRAQMSDAARRLRRPLAAADLARVVLDVARSRRNQINGSRSRAAI